MEKIIEFIREYPRYSLLILSFPFVFYGYSLFKNKVDIFLKNVIPEYNSLNISNNDPYIKSFFNQEKIKIEIEKTKAFIKKFLIFIFFILYLVFVLTLLNSSYVDNSEELKKQIPNVSFLNLEFGPFGDLFNGLLTPLLSFASIVFLLFTVIMQNIQMRATLTELQLSRLEMSESTDALQAQVKNLDSQKFDNILFSLIENYKILLRDLRDQKFTDENGFDINEPYENYVFEKINKQHSSSVNIFWNNVKDNFLPIFLMNYQMLKYIDENIDASITNKDAKRYIGIIRAITPKNILFLIYVNCGLGDFQKYRRLLEKFCFFEHLYYKETNINIFKKISSKYNLNVFGDRGRISSYIHSNREAMSFFLDPINKYKNNIKRIDISSLSNDEAVAFLDYAYSYEAKMMQIYRDEINENKKNVLQYCLSSNDRFVKFCNNDTSLLIDYHEKMTAIFDEAINSLNNELKRLKYE